MSPSLVLTSIALALLLAGCAQPPRAPEPKAACDPAEAYAQLRRREESVERLRARFSVVLTRPGEVRRAQGVVIVQKPDRFRLRLLSPFAVTMLDYLNVGEHARLTLPLEGKVLEDAEIGSNSSLSPVDLRQAFLRGRDAFPGSCTPRAAGLDATIDCRDASSALVRQFEVDCSTATLRRETSLINGVPQMVMEYADYRVADGATLPYGISLRYPAQQSTMQISVSAYEVNPHLGGDLFD